MPDARERARERRYARNYGITIAEYDALFVAQGGKCAICDRPPKKVWLNVDHDHKQSGRESVRGLLCSICNRKILGVIERYKVEPLRIVAYLRAKRPFAVNGSRGADKVPDLSAECSDLGGVSHSHALPVAPVFSRLSRSPVNPGLLSRASITVAGEPLDREQERRGQSGVLGNCHIATRTADGTPL